NLLQNRARRKHNFQGWGGTAARQELKQPDEARNSLAQAAQIFETNLPKLESGDLGENWPEWLSARILLREADSLIVDKSPGGN
ncbi:MAG TPA: hypothetical protein PLC99_25685, partial [Verrucomicrobiota bacterium]|nr:hypothetical protein [Verrucomicrobiota bacterium]